MRLQLMLGHLPALLHPKPRSALIVGCGAGVTAGSFILHPDIQRIVICEIEPLVPRVVARYFAFENQHVLENPRVEVVYDDARHYLLSTKETFDIITSDPIHPWMKGSAMLYTQEYFELVRRHLNPGGCVSQWVPLYESTEAVVKSEIATFCRAFADTTIWSNDDLGEGYDTVLLGRVQADKIDVDEIQARLNRSNFLSMTLSLDGIGFKSIVGLLTTYSGQGSDLDSWLRDAQINRDRNLRLQYLAGLALNADDSQRIYEAILKHRTYPAHLFIASEKKEQALRKALDRPSRSAAK
jgi:spermidine synthase